MNYSGYMWQEYDEALKVAQISEQYLKYSIAMLHTVEHHFYHALILCAIYDTGRNKSYLKSARKILKKFDDWAVLNPANFSHKALLIRAEIERVSNGGWDVAELYARAITSADQNGFIQIKAMANALAGNFFTAKKIEVAAHAHFNEAYYGYQLWGAHGIADKLARTFPAIASKQSVISNDKDATSFTASSRITTGAASSVSGKYKSTSLDMETIIKSTRAISSEINLSSLLQKLMSIMIENAGAEKGCFIRLVDGRLLLEAEGFINQKEVTILGALPLNNTTVPESIIQYTARVGESIMLDNAQSDVRFWDDPYIAAVQPKSLLSMPVSHQGEIKGVVYLENSLISGAFTPGRLELLQLLSTQAAISIENSLLYSSMEERVKARTVELSLLAENLEEANRLLEEITLTDALTQISNKRHFQQVYENEWSRAVRSGTHLTLMLIDIDCFKLYNDTYGHVEGDRCLKLVAGALSSVVCRAGDLLARFGGEEFIILLSNSSQNEAALIAKRLVDSVFELAIPHDTSLAENVVSISLGLAHRAPQKEEEPLAFIHDADQALYRAKTSGRNRFCV